MRKVVEKVLNNEISARQAADRYRVPRTTLKDRIGPIKHDKLCPLSHLWIVFT